MRRRNLGRGWGHIATVCVAVGAASGCSVHAEGITDLIGDGYSYVEFPGHRVLDKSLTRNSIDEKADGSPVAMGLTDEGELVIADLLSQAQCTVGPSSDFLPSAAYVDSGQQGTRRIAFVHDPDAEGWGTLAFVAQDCSEQVEGATQAKLLSWYTRLEPPRLLAEGKLVREDSTQVSNLLVCDPSLTADPCSPLAVVQAAEYRGNKLFTIEETAGLRQLVVRDNALQVLLAAGSDVTSMVVGTIGTWVAFSDVEGIHLATASANATSIEPLGVDACQLEPVTAAARGNVGISYRSPCEAGSLWVRLPDRLEPYALAPGAATPVVVGFAGSSATIAIYVTDPTPLATDVDDRSGKNLASWFNAYYWQHPPMAIGTLAFTTLGEAAGGVAAAAAPAGGTTVLGPSDVWLGSLSWAYNQRARFLSEYDGSTGRLLEFDTQTTNVTELATSVTDFSTTWAIERTEANSTDFVELRSNGSRHTVVKNVFDRGEVFVSRCTLGSIDCLTDWLQDEANDRRIVLSDVGDVGGTLSLLTRKAAGANLGAPEFLDSSVHTRGYGFLRGGDAALYLTQVDPSSGAGTLTARFIKTLDAFRVPHVSGWLELTGDYPGILYATRQGSRSALWFAKLR